MVLSVRVTVRSAIALMLLLGLVGLGAAQWTQPRFESIEPFRADQRIVGTHYFYWYDYPDEHFVTGENHDLLQDHFPDPEKVSYFDPDWHATQLHDCAAAGIDFILPVYWGVVDGYFRPGVSFSVQGLGPLRHAMKQRTRAGLPTPKIGMFYDTTTLLPGYHGAKDKLDLRRQRGQDIFYRTIRDFFYQVPPEDWATIDGRPLVVLYGAGFAGAHDQSVFDYTCQRFAHDFHGRRPYIIRDASWNATTDGTTAWGAALGGPAVFGHVAQIGPGYNDSAVPGRKTPIREREDGNFYRWSWNRVLEHDVRIVLLETWNEMHEGTSLCESQEYGRTYIELTREYADLFHQGKKANESITLRYPKPQPRPPSTRGEQYRHAEEVSAALGKGGASKGIRLVASLPDGPTSNESVGGKSCVATPVSVLSYIYFDIADPFLWEATAPVVVQYTYWDDGFEAVSLQYDSRDDDEPYDGAYKATPAVRCTQSGTWKTKIIRLTDARFVNRQNGGADFRLAVHGGRIAIASVSVRND